MDWFEIGRSHGIQGLKISSYETKAQVCEGFGGDERIKYKSGWYSGVDEFCFGQQGFAFGRTGKEDPKICPPARRTQFLEYYQKGKTVFNYEQENLKISEEIQKLSGEISNEKKKGESRFSSALIQKMNRITELETRFELNQALVSEIQKEVENRL